VHTCTHLYMCVCTLAYTYTHTLTPYSECLCRGLCVWHTRTHLYDVCVCTCIHTYPHTDTLAKIHLSLPSMHNPNPARQITHTHIHTHSLSLPLNLFIPEFVTMSPSIFKCHTHSLSTRFIFKNQSRILLLYEHMCVHTGNTTRISVSMCGTTTVHSLLLLL